MPPTPFGNASAFAELWFPYRGGRDNSSASLLDCSENLRVSSSKPRAGPQWSAAAAIVTAALPSNEPGGTPVPAVVGSFLPQSVLLLTENSERDT